MKFYLLECTKCGKKGRCVTNDNERPETNCPGCGGKAKSKEITEEQYDAWGK